MRRSCQCLPLERHFVAAHIVVNWVQDEPDLGVAKAIEKSIMIHNCPLFVSLGLNDVGLPAKNNQRRAELTSRSVGEERFFLCVAIRRFPELLPQLDW